MGNCTSSHSTVVGVPENAVDSVDSVIQNHKASVPKLDATALSDSSDSDATAKARALFIAGARGGAASLRLPEKLALAQALAAGGPDRSSRSRRQSHVPGDDRGPPMHATSGRLASVSSMPSRMSPNASCSVSNNRGLRTASGPSGGYAGSGANAIWRANSGVGASSRRCMDDTDAVLAVAKALTLGAGGALGNGRTKRRSSWASGSGYGVPLVAPGASAGGGGSTAAAVTSPGGSVSGTVAAAAAARLGRPPYGNRGVGGGGDASPAAAGPDGSYPVDPSRPSPSSRRGSTGTITNGAELYRWQGSMARERQQQSLQQHQQYSFVPLNQHQQQQPQPHGQQQQQQQRRGYQKELPPQQTQQTPPPQMQRSSGGGASCEGESPRPAGLSDQPSQVQPPRPQLTLQPQQQPQRDTDGRRPRTPSTPEVEEHLVPAAAAAPPSPAGPTSPGGGAAAATTGAPRRFLPRWSSLQRPPVDLGAQPKRPALKVPGGSPTVSTCASPIAFPPVAQGNGDADPNDHHSDPGPYAERLTRGPPGGWSPAGSGGGAAPVVAPSPPPPPAAAEATADATAARGGGGGADLRSSMNARAALRAAAWEDAFTSSAGGDDEGACEEAGGLGGRSSAPLQAHRPHQLLVASPGGAPPRAAPVLSPLGGGGRGDTRLSPRPSGGGGAAASIINAAAASPFTHPHGPNPLSPLSPSLRTAPGAASQPPTLLPHHPNTHASTHAHVQGHAQQPYSPARSPVGAGGWASPLSGGGGGGGPPSLASSGGSGRLITDLRTKFSQTQHSVIAVGSAGGSGGGGGGSSSGGGGDAVLGGRSPAGGGLGVVGLMGVGAEPEAGSRHSRAQEEAEAECGECSLPGGVPLSGDLAG